MKLKVGSSENREVCPPGAYAARCVVVVDAGTQTSTYGQDRKAVRKLCLGFEILDPDTRRKDGTAFALHRYFTLSTHEKANLRRALESWRGKNYSDADEIDLSKLAGAYAMVAVTNTASENGTFANIATVMPMMKGMERPAGTMPVLTYFIGESPLADLEKLPEWLREKVKSSPEFKALSATPAASAAAPATADVADDDIPW